MKLTDEQIAEFDEQGYLFLPNCFSEAEIVALREEAQGIYASDREEVWRETSGAPRTAFAAHTYNEAFRLLGAHPRLIDPVSQFFGEDVYMHQFKVNAKAAFDGDVWQWHQDYGTWARDDGMLSLHDALPIWSADVHSEKSQARHAGSRSRFADHLLSALDAGQEDGHRTG